MLKIYTKTGDAGETSLRGLKRVSKDDLCIELIGELDEISSVLGVVSSLGFPPEQLNEIYSVQHDLYVFSSCLAGFIDFDASTSVNRLEKQIDAYTEKLPELKDFVLPGGTSGAAHLYHARAICRRAERYLVSLSKKEARLGQYISYLNRLSDYLFQLARYVNHLSGISEKRIKEISS